MSKMRYPKCPYCGKEYHEVFGGKEGDALFNLATKGWVKEENVKCWDCGEKFRVTVKIMYYGSKIRK